MTASHRYVLGNILEDVVCAALFPAPLEKTAVHKVEKDISRADRIEPGRPAKAFVRNTSGLRLGQRYIDRKSVFTKRS